MQIYEKDVPQIAQIYAEGFGYEINSLTIGDYLDLQGLSWSLLSQPIVKTLELD